MALKDLVPMVPAVPINRYLWSKIAELDPDFVLEYEGVQPFFPLGESAAGDTPWKDKPSFVYDRMMVINPNPFYPIKKEQIHYALKANPTDSMALGPAIQEDERNVIGPWLHGLVKKAEKSKWLSRQDNKQYLVDYIQGLWSVTNGDFKAIEQLARNYKHSIHDMRKDGSIVQESVRGGSSLPYQANAIQLMLKQAALIKNVAGIDIGKYRAEGNRSL